MYAGFTRILQDLHLFFFAVLTIAMVPIIPRAAIATIPDNGDLFVTVFIGVYVAVIVAGVV